MAQHTCEIFVHIVYSPELSYYELMDREEALKTLVDSILFEAGGEYIHFEPSGDTLRAQCSLPAFAEDVFHSVCDKLLPGLDEHLEAKLLFVSKNLESLFLYTISRGKVQEACIDLPPAGPLGHLLRLNGNK